MGRHHLLSIAAALCFTTPCILAGESTHEYQPEEKVNLWVNKVGPYHNPQETYEYFKLPYCKPELGVSLKKKKLSMGEQIEGHDLTNSGYEVKFAVDIPPTKICSQSLDEETSVIFGAAVEVHYWYQMYLDDLPIWGMVGEKYQGEGKADKDTDKFIFTHRRFSIAFNGPRVIEVNLTSENLQPIKPGTQLDFSYSVKWIPTTKPFATRFERYLDYNFFEHQIHWFSIFNSFMMVIFLCGLVSLILLRTLRNDYARYTRDDDDMEGLDRVGEDSGWKQIHGDVFRRPPYLCFFAALIGTGAQLIVIVLAAVLFAILGEFHGEVYEERGELITTLIVCYALSSTVAGYASGSYYKQYFSTLEEKNSLWQQTMIYTVLLLPLCGSFIILILNSIAWYYDTSNMMHLGGMLKVFAIWFFVSFPLVVAGTLVGRHVGGKNDFPCRVNTIPRPIPKGPWYTWPVVVIPLTGILPFGSIFIEMYFVFTSFWNYKFYYVYEFMMLVFLILLIVSICTTIVAVYFTLNAENYHWQWISFLASGSTSGYVLLYSIYYFFWKTKMNGFLQSCFYFGYMGLFSFGFFILCGTVGLVGSNAFVKRIYRNIKSD
jgi:transmembrane 9 superfamily protein 3